jgi:hypothetical protein
LNLSLGPTFEFWISKAMLPAQRTLGATIIIIHGDGEGHSGFPPLLSLLLIAL